MGRTRFAGWMLIVSLAVTLFGAFGCKATRSDSRYFFSFGHLSDDAPVADVWIDETLVFEDLARGEITGYMRLRARPFTITYRVADSDEILAGPVEPDPIPSGGQQTVLLVGRQRDETLDLLRYNQKSGSASNDRARYLIAHGASDVDDIDLILNGDLVGRNVRYLDASRVVGEKGGPVQLRVRETETGIKLIGNRAYNVPPGRDYSVLLLGRTDDASLDVFVLQDDTGAFFEAASLIRFLHAIPSVEENLEIFIDGALAANRIQYGNSERYLAIAPGTYRIELRGGTSEALILDLGEVALDAGEDTTILCLESGDDGSVLSVRIDDPDIAGIELTGRVRFTNTALRVEGGELGPLDLFVDDVLIAGDVGFGGVSNYRLVESGTSAVRLVESATGTVLAERNFRIRQSQDYTIAALGVDGGEPGLELVRFEDDLDP